jgi:uncharacterized phiE125 gp8 family phage protein
MAYKIITAATVEPITLEEARAHLRIEPFGSPETHPDDTYVTALISVAREWCEQYTGRALASQTIEMALDAFPSGDIELPLAPVTSITFVKYVNAAGNEITLSNDFYGLDDYSVPNWLLLLEGYKWPETSEGANSVKIRMVVGNTSANLQSPIKAAMLLMIGNLYENRTEDQLATARASFNSLPLGVYNLLQPYKLNLGV